MFDKLRFSNYFTLLDLRAGYWNVKISEESRDLTTFCHGGKSYRWRKLPMGLSISGNVFQKIMSDIIGPDLDRGISIYLDDVLVFSTSAEEHLILIEKVLFKFAKAGILMNPTKCSFGQIEVNYLGYTVTKDGFKAQKHKTQAIDDYPSPSNKKELKRWIVLV